MLIMEEYVVLYITHLKTNEVFLLKKESKPNLPSIILDKLIGIGGKIENEDLGKTYIETILNATIREIKEEIGIELNRRDLKYRGFMQGVKLGGKIHFLTIDLDYKLNVKYIQNEGPTAYYPLTHHRENPKEFPNRESWILEKIFFSNEIIGDNQN